MIIKLIESVNTGINRIFYFLPLNNSLLFLTHNARDKVIRRFDLLEKDVSVVSVLEDVLSPHGRVFNHAILLFKFQDDIYYIERAYLSPPSEFDVIPRWFSDLQNENLKFKLISLKTKKSRLLAQGFNYNDAGFSSKNKIFVFERYKDIDVFDLDGNLIKQVKAHGDAITGFSFNTKETRLVTTSADRTFKYWDVPSFKRLKGVRGKEPFSAAFDKTDRYLAVGYDKGLIKIWDTRDWSSQDFKTGNKAFVSTLLFSNDGKRLYSADWEGVISIWEVEYLKTLEARS